MTLDFSAVAGILQQGVAQRAFPAASIEVGRGEGAIWRSAFGSLTYEPESPAATVDTVFDLASLTKVIVTASIAMRAVDEGRVALDALVSRWFREWRGADREHVTVRDLLAHSSGLTAYLPFFRDISGRAEYQEAICRLPLEYPPRSQSIYSDLGFMLLGFLLEDSYEKRANRCQPSSVSAQPRDANGHRVHDSSTSFRPFVTELQRITARIGSEPLAFNPPRSWRSRTAPTELDSWRGKLLIAEVHDENCWALGGVAGHAGLFGTAPAVGAFARAVLRTIAGEALVANPSTMREFIRPSGVAGSSRALGWDTMRPTSSCGTRLSPTAIGHTGFTGTSLWIDWERDLYVVLLTNRVHPTRENQALRAVRPQVHDAVVRVIEREGN